MARELPQLGHDDNDLLVMVLSVHATFCVCHKYLQCESPEGSWRVSNKKALKLKDDFGDFGDYDEQDDRDG